MKKEDELPRALREGVSDVASSEVAWRPIEHRVTKTAAASHGSRIGAIALALTLSAATCAGIWWGLRAVPRDRVGDATPRLTSLDPHVVDVVSVGTEPADVAVGEDAVWVSVPAQGSDRESSVVRIDPVSNEVVSRVPVEGYIEEIAAGAGGVWVWGARFDSPIGSTHTNPSPNSMSHVATPGGTEAARSMRVTESQSDPSPTASGRDDGVRSGIDLDDVWEPNPGDGKRDPGNHLVRRRIDPNEKASLWTGASSGAVDCPRFQSVRRPDRPRFERGRRTELRSKEKEARRGHLRDHRA